MSTALLQELKEEVRRLYIAGSDLTVGDFRLKKLLPKFEQLGERAPIFKRLGEGIKAVIEPEIGTEAHSAQRLQDLNQLLSSVLYTQGITSPEGEQLSLNNIPLSLSSHLSYRKLSAVQVALTTKGGGRYEIIEEAFKEGLFHDLRLVHLAMGALNDSYVEIAEFAADHILPAYGSQIIPLLVENFDPAGGKAESLKLKVIAKTGGDEVLDLIYQAAMTGSDQVRTTAIRLLAPHKAYEAELIEWSRNKKRVIREAAYDALAVNGSDSAVERLYEASLGKDRETVNSALYKCQSTLLTERLTRDLSAELSALPEVQKDKEKVEEIWSNVRLKLRALSDKQSKELESLYRKVLEQYPMYMKMLESYYLVREAVIYLSRIEAEDVRELLRQYAEYDLVHYKNSGPYVEDVFRNAQSFLSPERVYEEYVDILLKGYAASPQSNAGRERKRLLDTITDRVINREYRTYDEVSPFADKGRYTYFVEMLSQEQIEQSFDKRWLDHFIDQDEFTLVSAFARPGHQAAETYLLAKLKKSPEFRNRFANLFIMGLVRVGIQEDTLHEALMIALEDERNTECYEIEPFVFQQLIQLPSSYYERVQAVLPKYTAFAEEQLHYVMRNMREV